MRIGKGCRNCRHRHIKCVIRDGAQGCIRCAKVGRQCDLEPRFSFKNVRHVYQSTGASRSRFEFAWDDQQVWVKVSTPLSFVLERCDSPADWELDSTNVDTHWGHLVTGDCGSEHEISSTPGASTGPVLSTNGPSTVAREEQITVENVPNDSSPQGRSVMTIDNALSSPIDVERHRTLSFPRNQDSCSISSPVDSRSSIVTNEPVTASSLDLPGPVYISLLSHREAFFLRSYISKLAPWCDVCDIACHFATEVPRRALEVPMVLYAVLAVSSRHQAILSGSTDEVEASTFHGRCLELLISALSQPEETWDDNLLATVVILRIYEELDNRNDKKCHIVGSSRLLNTVSKFSSSGGLAEAASWLFLRQAIYVSLVHRVPLELNLDNYERSSVFDRFDNESYANVIIFLFARALQLIYPVRRDVAVDMHAWDLLQESIDRWYSSKPSSFAPFHYRDASMEESRPFPELWMISPAAVVGLQYYHAASILMTIHKPRPQSPAGFQAARLMRIEERTVSTHIAIVTGLAVSNSATENANFTACHVLSAYGYCLRNPLQRQGAVSFLVRVEKTMGWRTSWIIEALEEQWRELDGLSNAET